MLINACLQMGLVLLFNNYFLSILLCAFCVLAKFMGTTSSKSPPASFLTLLGGIGWTLDKDMPLLYSLWTQNLKSSAIVQDPLICKCFGLYWFFVYLSKLESHGLTWNHKPWQQVSPVVGRILNGPQDSWPFCTHTLSQVFSHTISRYCFGKILQM